MKRIVFALLLLAGSCAWVNAQQVGINTDNPNPLTVLDITNVSSMVDSVSYRGIMAPRMSEAERDRINVSDPINANGLLIYNTDEDCFNYYSRNLARWKSVCGEDNGMAEINTVYCNSLEITGNFAAGTTLGTDVYMELSVEVSKAGSYQFSGIPINENGYYFSGSGIFFLPGIARVRLPAMGTPHYATTAQPPDTVNVYVNGNLACSTTISVGVGTAPPTFSTTCNQGTLNGNYIAGTMLNTSNNTIQVTLTGIDNDDVGKIYRMTTNTVNGYYFAGTGYIIDDEQLVTLTGYGTPIDMGPNELILYTNSGVPSGEPATEACTFDVRVAARRMRILGVGLNSDYYLGNAANGMNRLINNTALFSPAQNAQCQLVNGFEIIQISAPNNVNMATAINNYNPDIIIIQYNWTGDLTSTSNASRDSLISFVNNRGGVLILCSDGGLSGLSDRSVFCQTFVNRIFDTNTLTASGIVTGPDTQPFATLTQSLAPILDNPYSLRGLSMARDADYNFGFIGIQEVTDLQVIAWQTENSNARAFMHASKGFVFIGDGAPFAYQANNTQAYNYPMKLDANYFPATNIWSDPHTENAQLFCNIMAWAIEYAQTHRP